MIYAPPGGQFEARIDGCATGLAGTIGVQILDNAGGVALARTTEGITEDPAGSGSYIVTLTAPSTAGSYSVFWDTGTVTPTTTASEDLLVTASAAIVLATAGDYITQAQLKSARELASYTFADGEIPTVITTASRVIDKLCGRYRRFYLDATDQTRYYRPDRAGMVWIDDLASITSLATDANGDGIFEYTWTLNSDYVLGPENADADSRPWEYLEMHPFGRYRFPTGVPRSVKVTGRFGWPAVPSAVVTATLLLATRYLVRTREATFGIVAVGGPIDGTMMRLARTDPDIPGLLSGLSRKRLIA